MSVKCLTSPNIQAETVSCDATELMEEYYHIGVTAILLPLDYV